MAERNITLREFLHNLNFTEKDVDVYVDGIDSIAVVGGDIRLTPLAIQKFGPVLDMKINKNHVIVGSYEDYDRIDYGEGNLNLAWNLFTAMAGYCSCEEYDAWFTGSDAQLI